MKALPYVQSATLPLVQTRVADYLELVRPRVSVLVLFTVAVGYFLAAAPALDWLQLLHVVLGTGLVAAGASALNQLFERRTDALMQRTENRPLPAGRLPALHVLALGVFLTALGLTYMLLCLAHPEAALVAAFTFASYVFLYTPLKKKSPLNTLVGAVPGALPPVIGWTAARGTFGWEAAALFLIVFLWQVPHFLAIAWIYRAQYARAGLQMLPVVDPTGYRTGRQMVRYCLVLLPISLLPAVLGMAGPVYVLGAIVLGLGFLTRAIGFGQAQPDGLTAQARKVLRASLVYLPALLMLLLVDTVWMTYWRS